MNVHHELIDDLVFFNLETHEYLDIKLQGGQKICDSQTLAPVFYDLRASFDQDFQDWGNA